MDKMISGLLMILLLGGYFNVYDFFYSDESDTSRPVPHLILHISNEGGDAKPPEVTPPSPITIPKFCFVWPDDENYGTWVPC